MAQIAVTGKVTTNNQNSLPGATIKLKNRSTTIISDDNGNYSLSLAPGKYVFSVSYLGYKTEEKSVDLNVNTVLNFNLSAQSFVGDEVVVSATRASKNMATTFKNLDKAALEKNNLGQDLPYLLNQTPSVVVSSDAGTGIGYTGIRIRGSDATRINVTVNGIPLNDAESQGSYFINLPDLASSVDNIQIQRGVGTSTNGAGAFGASLNIQTTTRRDSAYAELNNTFGSYNTWKNTVNLGTGLINNKFSFDGRLSRIKSDGYV
ncbi:MAG: TonB-dependent receptor, partial [Flavobacteriales bacterium]